MEKVTVTVCRREYSLKTDEDPEKIKKLAQQLEKSIAQVARVAKNTSEVEMTTLAALILICDIESVVRESCAAEIDGLKGKLALTKEKLEEQLKINAENPLKAENEKLLSEKEELQGQVAGLNEKLSGISAENENKLSELNGEIKELKSELFAEQDKVKEVSAQKDGEIKSLKEKAKKDEEEFWTLSEEREKEIKTLKEDMEKLRSESRERLDEKERENKKMRGTLENYEATFDLYVKNKEEELRRAQEDIEALKLKCSEMEKRLAQSGDVQMTIC